MKERKNKIEHKKICLIICYFGKLPNYFQLWLNSCRYNLCVDFLLFTDDKFEYDYPKNVNVIYTTFSEIKKQIQNCFDFDICLEKPYKLCDYRPAFGIAFKKYIEKYDFWGHCDLDVIFGNLSKYLNNINLEKYDRIYSQGHFTLYKNDGKTNKLFMEIIDEKTKVPYYKEVFTNNGTYVFDEWAGISRFYKNKFYNIYIDRNVVADISVRYNNLFPIFYDRTPRYIFEWKNNNNSCELFSIHIENGVIKKNEFMYIHLQKRNMDIALNKSDHFYIVPDKFLDAPTDNIYKFIKDNTHVITLYRFKFISYRFNNLKKKLIKLFNKRKGKSYE